MSFLTDSKGNLSFIRLSILIAVIGAVFLGGSVMTFLADQQSRRAPLHVELPGGAQPWGAPGQTRPGQQVVFYRVPGGDPAAIASFYDGKMLEHYGSSVGDQNRETCVRTPPVGQYTNDPNDKENVYASNYVPGPEFPPYYWKCMFDRSGLNATQDTLVTIFPGARTDDPVTNSEGSVVIRYEQHWQSQ
jgi:hypothetical protein